MTQRIAVGLTLFLVLFSTARSEPPAELKPFQGKWVLKSATLAGRDHGSDFKALTLTITGDQYVVMVDPNKDTGQITLDLSKSPKWITLASSAKGGPFKGRTMPGIFEMKDDSLTVCLNAETDQRPTEFAAPEKTPVMLFVFVREKK